MFLAAITSLYATLLNTPKGRHFTDSHTAESVIIGVGLVLSALRVILSAAARRRGVAAFAGAGAALVVRSLMKRKLICRPGD